MAQSPISVAISAVAPNITIRPGDRLLVNITLRRTPANDPRATSAVVTLMESINNGAYTEAVRTNLSFNSSTGLAQGNLPLYNVPNLICSAGYQGCPETFTSLDDWIRTVKLEIRATATTSGVTTSAEPYPLSVTPYQIQSLSPNRQPLNTRRPARLTLSGTQIPANAYVTLSVIRPGNCFFVVNVGGQRCTWNWTADSSGPASADFTINTTAAQPAFDSEDKNVDFLGSYDVIVSWQEPGPSGNGFAGGSVYRHAVLRGGFSVDPPAADDAVRITRVQGIADAHNPDPTRRVAFTWMPGDVTTVNIPPGGVVQFTRIEGTYRLSKFSQAVIYPLVRINGQLYGGGYAYVRNTFEQDAALTDQGYTPAHDVSTFPITLPSTPVSQFEFLLIASPPDENSAAGGDYNQIPARSFASSNIVPFVVLGPDTVPDTAPKPPLPTDSRFITASGPGIRTACLKRSEGTLEIPIDVRRVVGEVDAGRLKEPDVLIANGVVSRNARLRIVSFGRQVQGSSERADRVLFNGKEVKTLTGSNEKWTDDYFATIPIADVLFPARVAGSPATPQTNRLRIEIDGANTSGAGQWCASVAWVELSFSALAPVVLVHGNGQGDDNNGGKFWEGGVLDTASAPRLQMRFAFLDTFKEGRIPYDNSISMPTDNISSHGDLLGVSIPRIAGEFGSKHVHIVAHSKGGLDTRDFLARTIPPNFGVYSFTTLSTPHRGSAGPDYQIDAQGASAAYSDDRIRTEIGAASPPNKGTPNLRVSEAARFNQVNVPLLPKEQRVDGETHTVYYFAVAADMNLDDSTTPGTGNPSISYDETYGLPGQESAGMGNLKWAYVIQSCYRLTGYVLNTYTETKEIPIAGPSRKVTIKVVRENLSPTFRPNDIAVTRESASVGPFQEIAFIKANHSTIASPETAGTVLTWIRQIQPMPQ